MGVGEVVLVCLSIGLCSAALPVEVDIATTSRAGCDLPEKISVKLKTKDDKITLHLTMIEEVDEESPVFLLRHEEEESSVTMETSSPSDNEVTIVTSEYQDEVHLASMSITCRVDDLSADLKLEGSLLLADGRQYLLKRGQDITESYTLEVQEESVNIEDLADFVIDPDIPLIDVNATTSRATLPDVYIDVVTLVDYSVYRKWSSRSNSRADTIKNIKHHFAHMMNAINLRYKTASPNIHVVLAGFVIEDQGQGQWFERVRQTDNYYQNNVIDGQQLLTSVWQMTRTTQGFPQNDHVLTFTAYDMYTTGSNLLGIAYMQSVCRSGGMSVSLVEYNDRFTDDMLVATHEIGHGLSAQHDGTGNGCSATSKYIMAPSYDGTHNLWNNNPHYFSTCSVQYLTSFISNLLQYSGSARCFRTRLLSPTVPDVDDELTGQYYDVNEQCRQINGQQSYYCNEPVSASICKRMPCYNPSWRTCTRHSAADGTRCGQNKVCRLGSCVTAPAVTPVPPVCSRKCANGGTLNKRDCTCRCEGSFTGSTCEICLRRCPTNQQLDTKLCRCVAVRPQCTLVCMNGGTLSKNSCSCSCPGKFSGNSCERCSIRCPQGQRLDSARCSCVKAAPICSRKCLNGATLNARTCTCSCLNGFSGQSCGSCSRSCPTGFQISTKECICVPVTKNCRQSCWNGGVLNNNTCTCQCRWNYFGDSCQYCSTRCPRGQMMKRGQCKCVPVRCQYRDSASCQTIARFNMCSSYFTRCPWTCRRC